MPAAYGVSVQSVATFIISPNFRSLAGRIKNKDDCLRKTLKLFCSGLNCLPTGWLMLKASDMVRKSHSELAFLSFSSRLWDKVMSNY